MIRAILGLASVVAVSLALAAEGQRDKPPFALLEEQARRQARGWHGDQRALRKLFDQERRRLGKNFQRELLRFIGTDLDKHAAAATFLLVGKPPHGTRPLPYFALLIDHQMLVLLRRKGDQDSRATRVGMSAHTAIRCAQLGLGVLATHHKETAERLVAAEPILAGAWPSMTRRQRELYEAIPYRKPVKKKVRPPAPPRPAPK